MKNANLLDQFFLVDKSVINLFCNNVELKETDTVLEIGPGKGALTELLARGAKKLIAVEIDKKFSEDLKKIPGNIRVIFDDALIVLKDKKKYPLRFDKIVGSLPSLTVEPLMHVLTGADFKLAIFLIPLKFADKLLKHECFSAFFELSILSRVSRKSFFPVPKTNWAMIKMTRLPDPLKTGDEARFLKQYLYRHPKAKLRNALAEGLIKFYRSSGVILTKNQAREIVATKTPLYTDKTVEKEGFNNTSSKFTVHQF